ncbi:hypothetical protein CcaverHIS002_0209370 [Cutaneotrichosporon cavernicola]|uniref:Transcription factor CBF/NF-Y/archaeal histone domain-containing protein n=1 Tax=Cutaneotrichosporon cavernicola TaxID=279322 RepID=A0AA48I598_9TREE|nr:uncharacterized protein CcaverHIS019_0209390 [Cutaneotrichosporon cavernicola]BEI81777.1 hypothetical protein CcaverHIS002_0209370 [Cutaneotrichosporon cavernicola]BEI89577.1 hypothetical protein CcaverHIS019_0209390 [Cutaneotrichosporon cavernicola]BEI97349.1 hypothetical protein CcaverHIS631_0209380 [Cutaneotrichosporon cavernicola]BEJ05125.1 hypothetical protein CcaverHIS641_0209420 [Cutaneotrichosporon cavernicola]
MPPKMIKRSKNSRFPVARIKKIMQMDEEVGKLASATPVMISKSLECFLQLLIDETAKETRERGSRKMVPYHLKAMIDKSDQFDFLRELVESIPDPQEPKTPARRKSTAAAEGSARKRGPAVGRAQKKEEVPAPGSLPAIGTWKRESEGAEGPGEGGRGMFDDHEDDNYDDY